MSHRNVQHGMQLNFKLEVPKVAKPVDARKRKGDSQHEQLVTFQEYQSPYPLPYQSPYPPRPEVYTPPMVPTFKSQPAPPVPVQQVQQQPANIYTQAAMPFPMPSPVPSEPAQSQQQAQQPQADEWTEVTTKSKSKAKRRRKSPVPTADKPTAKILTPKVRNPPLKHVTLAKIQIDFNGKMKTWQASECRKTSLNLLEKIQPEGGWTIEKALCLGSGSFSRENGECRKRSMGQFVVFLDLVRHLQRVGKKDVEMYVQEPQYTDTDKAFLQTLRIHVLDVDSLPDPVPEGYVNEDGLGTAILHLGRETFLFEPFMDMNEAMLRDISSADVSLYIGSSVRGLMGRWGAVGDLARAFEGSHGIYQFPRFEEDPNVLEGLGIYWKPEVDEDD